jgi:hypothetical protein
VAARLRLRRAAFRWCSVQFRLTSRSWLAQTMHAQCRLLSQICHVYMTSRSGWHTCISCPDHWFSGSCARFGQITSQQAGMARMQLAKALVVWEAVGSKSGAAYQPHFYRNK